MEFMLIPWCRSWSICLRIYSRPVERAGEGCDAEISTWKGQKIALELLQKYATSLKLTVPRFIRTRMMVVVEVPDELGEGLLSALKRLDDVRDSREIPDSLVENPTLEGLESFLSLRKLLKG